MKTTFKTYSTFAQGRAKQREYEAKTGLKWDFYFTGAGCRLTAIVTKDTPVNETAAAALLPHVTKTAQTFAALADSSGLSLADVLAGAKSLMRSDQALPEVNRNGNLAAIRRK